MKSAVGFKSAMECNQLRARPGEKTNVGERRSLPCAELGLVNLVFIAKLFLRGAKSPKGPQLPSAQGRLFPRYSHSRTENIL